MLYWKAAPKAKWITFFCLRNILIKLYKSLAKNLIIQHQLAYPEVQAILENKIFPVLNLNN